MLLKKASVSFIILQIRPNVWLLPVFGQYLLGFIKPIVAFLRRLIAHFKVTESFNVLRRHAIISTEISSLFATFLFRGNWTTDGSERGCKVRNTFRLGCILSYCEFSSQWHQLPRQEGVASMQALQLGIMKFIPCSALGDFGLRFLRLYKLMDLWNTACFKLILWSNLAEALLANS